MGHLHLACRPAGTLIGERWHRLAGGARIRISPVRSVQQLPRRPGGRPRTRLPEPAAARPAQRPLVRQPRRALPWTQHPGVSAHATAGSRPSSRRTAPRARYPARTSSSFSPAARAAPPGTSMPAQPWSTI